ncbi:translation initiation factor IF-2-like [Schistocerca americana]|uniref:translation initiation factor IF-2-like n=1 Tax=Schistocerca americana TaxID=7009 RepID=UPI001F4FD47D|nr:translation initiation factor IF-2-like [Schistocerca americana]
MHIALRSAAPARGHSGPPPPRRSWLPGERAPADLSVFRWSSRPGSARSNAPLEEWAAWAQEAAPGPARPVPAQPPELGRQPHGASRPPPPPPPPQTSARPFVRNAEAVTSRTILARGTERKARSLQVPPPSVLGASAECCEYDRRVCSECDGRFRRRKRVPVRRNRRVGGQTEEGRKGGEGGGPRVFWAGAAGPAGRKRPSCSPGLGAARPLEFRLSTVNRKAPRGGRNAEQPSALRQQQLLPSITAR